MAYYYKYPINYAPNESGDTTAFAVKQLIRERNYIYQILNNIVAGNTAFVKAGVLVATTGNISLSGEQTIDGVSVEEGDRVLVWKQGNSVENGVYVVSKGQWKRADDADDDGDFANGYFTGVAKGTYAGQLFTQDGTVSVNVSPLIFRNIIQGDRVSQEVNKARDEANQAKETARGYADNANKSKEQAETAKVAAEEAANKAGAAQTETEKAKEDVLLKEKSVETYFNNVTEIGKEVTDNQNRATEIFNNVLAKQGDLEKKQKEIKSEQEEAGRLLTEAQQERTVIIQSVADGKLYSEEAKKASISAEQSAKSAEESKIYASQSVNTINELVDNANIVHENIKAQVQKAESVNEETKVIEAKALQTKTEIENLKGETESARDDAINRWNNSKTILDNTLLEAQNAKHGAEEARAGAEKESAAAKVSEANAKNSANMSAIEAEKARVEAGNAKTEAVNAGTEVEKAKAEVLKAQTEAERALTHSNKSEEAETEARKEAEKAKTAADKAENTLQAALATLDLNSYAKKESLVGLATTDYVDGRIKHVVGTAPEALDTLGEIATALTENKDKIGTIITEISTKADRGTVENALMGKAQKADVYTKEESDNRYQRKGEGGGNSDAFYQWLKERNYDLTNFQGLEGVFPVKDFPEIKAANLAGGDTKIAGTGAPNTIVEYDGKQAQISSDGYFVLEGITPLPDGDLIEIICYDYAGRKKIFSVAVGKINYAVPEGTTEITNDIVKQYNLNRAGKLIFPPSVKSVGAGAFNDCTNLTSVLFPACTSVGAGAFNDCTNLTSVLFPACTSVGAGAFGGCTNLTSVSFPACTRVGDYAFSEDNELKTIILAETWVPSYNPNIPTTATVYNQDKTKKVDWNTMKWVNV